MRLNKENLNEIKRLVEIMSEDFDEELRSKMIEYMTLIHESDYKLTTMSAYYIVMALEYQFRYCEVYDLVRDISLKDMVDKHHRDKIRGLSDFLTCNDVLTDQYGKEYYLCHDGYFRIEGKALKLKKGMQSVEVNNEEKN